MLFKKHVWQLVINYCKHNSLENHRTTRLIHQSVTSFCKDRSSENKQIKLFEGSGFEGVENKTRNAYLDMVKIFIGRDVHRRGHVEFIYSALKNMESFHVHKDLEVYKSLIDVLPKGKFIPQNIFQAEFMHYPKQQQCIIDLLEQMEDNGVMPDYEMEDMLLNIFGKRGYPLRKFWRMMYWMPKFKNLTPWPVPNPVPMDAFELAKIAINRISSADVQSELTIYQTADIGDSIEDTWIVSSYSPQQKRLLEMHDVTKPIYVEGFFRVWIKDNLVNYFILRTGAMKQPLAEPEDTDDVSHINVPLFNMLPNKSKSINTIPSVHEQEDGTIYALCATGTSSRDSLLSWIRHLEKEIPILANCHIVFTLRIPERQVAPHEESDEKLPNNV